ncbi:MAG: EF2563 family selenium-dependent molybdenum hydroxylase system protein [Chloroflexi bacterium]|nr:EF2563 family selenium-dependent molybdenum hydroxylase system protein [Chloroflexota bacterium]
MGANPLILLRGGGDLASGVAYRLRRAGLPVIITELAKPLAVRTTVSYGMAAVYGAVIVEGIVAQRAALDDLLGLYAMLEAGIIPVLIDPDGASIAALEPAVVIDGRMAKTRQDTRIDQAPLVIGLGPGFTAGEDCHAVIETNRGHYLGRVYWRGSAEPDTGLPASLDGRQAERVLRAPCDGLLKPEAVIGQLLQEGQLIARVGERPVYAPFTGVLRGLLDDDTPVTAGMKIGDLDPRARREHCFTISDKSLAVGGGALEAVLAVPPIRALLSARTVVEKT